MSTARFRDPGERLEHQAAEMATLTNNDAEQALLAALLCKNSEYSKISGFLRPADFAYAVHARIYEAIGKFVAAGQVANPITLQTHFARDEALIAVGGGTYLAELAVAAITLLNTENYGRAIADLAHRRRMLTALDGCREDILRVEIGQPAAKICEEFIPKLAAAAPKLNGHDPSSRIAVYDAGDMDVAKIPPRGWLLGVSFCRKFISGAVSEGGVGKTAIRYVQYLSLASGRSSLSGEHVHVRSRVLIACFEDDLDEVKRRIAAAMLRHGVTIEDIKGWLYYCVPRGLKLLETSAHNDHAAVAGVLYRDLRRIISELQIDMVSIDPFIKAHGVSENDNNLVDQVCTMLAGLGDELDVAIDLVSHARKGATGPDDADRDRGASAKRDAGRLMRNLTTMSADEAELAHIDEKDRRDYVRLDDAKVNITRRSATAMWFRLVGVPLGNRTDTYPNGDEVQTAVRWPWPDAFSKLDIDTIDGILTKIEAGPYEGGRYSPAPNATDRKVWPVIQEFFPEMADKESKHIIKTWLKNGVLVVRDHKDPKDRHDRPSIFVGKRPGDTWDT